MSASIVNGFSIKGAASGGTSPYSFAINGVDFKSSGLFADIPNGNYTITAKDSKNCIGTTTAALVITDLDIRPLLKVFPNPVTNTLIIEGLSGTTDIGITDSQGRTLVRQETQRESVEMNVSGLPAGLYVVDITERSGNLWRVKVVKR